MNGKKIWIISHYATPIKYGYGNRLFLLSEEFIKLGYEVTIFASTSNYQLTVKPAVNKVFTHENINGIDLVWVKGINYTNTSGFKRVFSWFVFSFLLLFYKSKKEDRPDIVIVSSLSLIPVFNGWLYKKRFPDCRFIFEIRDIWPLSIIEIGGYSKYHPLVIVLGWFEKFGYKHADHIVATMPGADKHIKTIFKKGFKFTCIPHGVDSNLIKQSVELTDEENKTFFPGSGFIIGYTGSLGPSNSMETLINAAWLIKQQEIEDIYFILLGEGNAKTDLMKLASGLDNVFFLPKISKNKIQSFLNHCDILYAAVKPLKLYDYGISLNKVMDYMMCGKPIIMSFSGYENMVSESECGIVVPAEDPEKLSAAILEYYYMEKSKLVDVGLRGRNFVLENRTFEKLAGLYNEIFLSI